MKQKAREEKEPRRRSGEDGGARSTAAGCGRRGREAPGVALQALPFYGPFMALLWPFYGGPRRGSCPTKGKRRPLRRLQGEHPQRADKLSEDG